MDEDVLRSALAGAVPQAPDASMRAASARNRAVRHRNRLMAATAVAVVLAIAGPVAGFSVGDNRDDRPLDGDGLGRFDCPSAQTGSAPALSADARGPLDPDAVRVRLCDVVGRGEFQAPNESLSGGAAADLAARIADLPPSPGGICEGSSQYTYGFLFAYAGGGTRLVTTDGQGCGGVYVDGELRGSQLSTDELLQAFKAAVLAQRTELGEPAERNLPPSTGPSCDRGRRSSAGGPSLFDVDPNDLRLTVLCVPRGHVSGQLTDEIELNPRDALVLVDDLRAHLISVDELRSHYPLGCLTTDLEPYLVAWNRWGDRFRIERNECNSAFAVYTAGIGRPQYWDPGPAASALMESLVVQSRSPLEPPRASTRPDLVVTLWADMLDLRDGRADSLWVGGAAPPITGPVTVTATGVRPGGDPLKDYAWSHVTEVWATLTEEVGDCVSYQGKIFLLVRVSEAEPWQIHSVTNRGGARRNC